MASDGVHVVVADTDHNRVLIWNRIPTSNNAPADVVVGQQTFNTASVPGNTPNAKSMRGPQGVWIQNGRLYVADTQNNRVLIFNRIPTSNGVAADVVLGQPDFTTFVEPDLTQQKNNVTANQLLNPGRGQFRRPAHLCDRPGLQPGADLELDSDEQRRGRRCGYRPAGPDQFGRQ